MKYFWWSAVCGFFLGFFSPTHALVLYLALFGLLILSAVRLFFERNEKSKIVLGLRPRTIITLVVSYTILTIPSALYIDWAFTATVWKVVKDWEATRWFPMDFWEFAMGAGPLFFLSIPAMIYIIYKYYILVSLPLLTLFFLFSPSYAVSLKTQNQGFTPPINFNIYPYKNLYDGLVWLEKNTKPQEIVFSDITLGNLIPAYAGNMVYVGHSISTVNYQKKLQDVAKFYKTGMTSYDARKFLLQRKIRYVVWSYDEHGYQGNPQKYASFLTLLYSNLEIQIYVVK